MKLLASYNAQNPQTQAVTGIDFFRSEETDKIYAVLTDDDGSKHLVESPVIVRQLAKRVCTDYVERRIS